MHGLRKKIEKLAEAAQDQRPVTGLTHGFYRYPARFSPQFAATAIKCFSQPGELVLDPYMGGGTTVVEALAANRRVVGNDLNALAAFIAKVKTSPLSATDIRALQEWANSVVPTLSYHTPREEIEHFMHAAKMRNLSISRARFIAKVMACALSTIDDLPTAKSRRFAKCVLLQVGQWALDGRKKHTPVDEFRARLTSDTHEMLSALAHLVQRTKSHNGPRYGRPIIANLDAAEIHTLPIFSKDAAMADLVVTSPPYPGVHVLYHRWQVDGRKETPAPYWVTNCNDGQGASYYNFGNRHNKSADDYFAASFRTLETIRSVMKDGAIIVQMIAFSNPDTQLPRYLKNMARAGFFELSRSSKRKQRIWREVPNRRWYANGKGALSTSREVVLLHKST